MRGLHPGYGVVICRAGATRQGYVAGFTRPTNYGAEDAR